MIKVMSKDADHSVASTEQAASAENLRNHTPSLENLVARSRVRDDLPLSSGVQRLVPESIAESRVEELGSSPDTSEPTALTPQPEHSAESHQNSVMDSAMKVVTRFSERLSNHLLDVFQAVESMAEHLFSRAEADAQVRF